MPSESSAIAILLSLFDRAYDRRSWHGPNLRGSLRGVSAADAARRPIGGGHNVWEIAVHAAYWKYVVLRALTGGKRGAFGRKGSNWFAIPSNASEADWKADLALLEATHRALRGAIRKTDPKTLDRPLPGKKTSRGELISGAAAHDFYHAGQVQLIKRMMPQANGGRKR
jgi:uncharacterized damage-inducible protein DinB